MLYLSILLVNIAVPVLDFVEFSLNFLLVIALQIVTSYLTVTNSYTFQNLTTGTL